LSAPETQHLRICTEDVLHAIEDWDNKQRSQRDVRPADRSAL